MSKSPSGILGKIGVTLFLAIFLAMGLFFLGMLGQELGKVFATYSWKETPATILSSSVAEKKTKGDPFFVEVSYRYQWEGRTFTSANYHSSPKSFGDYQKAQARVAALPAGTVTVCYVNPQDPATVILRREGLWMVFFLLIPLVFVAIGGGGIYGTWFGKATRSKPVSSRETKGQGGVLLIGALFVAVGGGFFGFWFLPALAKSLASQRWTETPCTVISSRVKSHSGKSTTYSVDIFYRYTVDGREYKSNRYGNFGGSSSGRAGKAAVVAKYPEGSKRVCYVNPKNPGEVVLKPGVGWDALLGLIPTAFLTMGIFLILASRKKTKQVVLVNPFLATETGGGVSSVEARDLKPKSSPFVRLIAVLVFALVWNGIISLFLWDIIGDLQRGSSTKWIPLLFFLPFVLIGLGAIVMVGYFFMALTNPRCRLRVTPGLLFPGQMLEVAWTISGSAGRIECLRIFLEGREEVVKQQGKSSRTDRQVFARLAVTEVPQGLEMAQGTARCRLPDGVPPSFDAPHNKIIWSLKVHGGIARWPDVNEEYEITVVPGGTK